MVIMPLVLMFTNSITNLAEFPFYGALLNSSRGLAEVVSVWLLDLIHRWRNALHYDRIADEAGVESELSLL